ncbi:MAG: MarR family transcriptional regulator [Pseudomonadota bacterium]
MAHPETLGGLGATQTALLRLLLRNKAGLTVDGVIAGLGISRTAVNQHLTALERDGYVVRKDVIATGGRPSRVFALSAHGVEFFPKKYDLMSVKMLETLIDAIGPDGTRRALEKIGKDLGAELSGNTKARKLAEILPPLTDLLEELGFDATLKTDAQEQVISAHNCIYHALAQAHPEICALDLALLREASGAKVEHLSCMAKGDNACCFKFTKKSTAS